MSVLQEVLKANAGYVATFGAKGKLSIPPARHFTILTCMDARLDPAKYAGLAEGDAHVIRNAGGRASDDALRSLVISYKLLARISSSSFTIPTAACCFSRTRLCGISSPVASRLRSSRQAVFAILGEVLDRRRASSLIG
jgi:hypothetical protein